MEQQNDFEKFGTLKTWERELGLSASTIRRRLDDARGITGKLANGVIVPDGFFSESKILDACGDLLGSIPQCDETGRFIIDGIVYGTAEKWAEDIGLSPSTVLSRLRDVTAIKGKTSLGRVRDFYPENAVRSCCAELVRELPQADTSGFFIMQGPTGSPERFATVKAWSSLIGLSDPTIRQSLEAIQGVTGKASNGRVVEHGFYPESVIQKLRPELQSDVPKADPSGFATISTDTGPERHAPVTRWAKELGLHIATLRARLKGCIGVTAKNAGGAVVKDGFFSESVVRNACADLLADIPRANKDGFFMFEGQRYGTIRAWARELKTGVPAIQRRLGPQEGITGKDSMGHVLEKGFISELVVRQKCADLFFKSPTNGE